MMSSREVFKFLEKEVGSVYPTGDYKKNAEINDNINVYGEIALAIVDRFLAMVALFGDSKEPSDRKCVADMLQWIAEIHTTLSDYAERR